MKMAPKVPKQNKTKQKKRPNPKKVIPHGYKQPGGTSLNELFSMVTHDLS